MSRKPLILGLGGTIRAGSSTEKALVCALNRAEALGAETKLLGGTFLGSLPIFDPRPADATPAQLELAAAVRAADGLIVASPGYHGSISGETSVLSHTYNPAVVSHVALNGTRVGESGINALVALACQAPVGLITGDQVTIAEADPFLPDAERVVVKESFTRFGASSLHPEVARELIADGARRAVERAAAEPSEVWEIAASADSPGAPDAR